MNKLLLFLLILILQTAISSAQVKKFLQNLLNPGLTASITLKLMHAIYC